MDKKTKIIERLSNGEKVYEIKVGDVTVEMNYSKDNKKIDECMLNVLKQKCKKS